MRLSPLLLTVCTFSSLPLSSATASDSSWALVQCAPHNDEVASEFRRKFVPSEHGLGSGSNGFPNTDADVVEAFRAQILSDPTGQEIGLVPSEETVLTDRVRSGDVSYSVTRVSEWQPKRCSRIYGTSPYYFLVRIHDKQSNRELARATIHLSGLLQSLEVARADSPGLENSTVSLAKMIEEASAAAKSAGLSPENLQFVALSSPTHPCSETSPCIAFRSSADSYLFRSGSIFKIDYPRTKFANSQLVSNAALRNQVESQIPAQGGIATLGGDEMTILRPIAPTSKH